MTDDEYRPFKGLPKHMTGRLPDRPDADEAKHPKRPGPVPDDAQPEDDAALFLRAVAGAAPPGDDTDAALTHTPMAKLSGKKKKGRGKRRAEAAAPGPGGSAPAPESTRPTPPQSVEPAHAPKSPAPEDAFLAAMRDVTPLDGKGRDRPARPEPGPAPPPPENPDDYVRRRLEQLVQGELHFDCSLTDEFSAGQVRGLDPRIFNKLKAGAYSVEAHLDLHGLTLEPAWQEVTDFIRRQYTQGRRCLLLVTGRGLNSPDGRGVLRGQVQSWLTRDPLRRVVLAFVTAQPRHGGAGALYVLLRKFKKTGGKVRWDRMPPDIDMS